MLQSELVNSPEVFGEIVKGSEAEPAVYMESVHHILKLDAGVPNLRPAWFFDIHEQGEALADVGTHLVDLAQWTLFPDAAMDYRKDVDVLSGSRWPTAITAEQFRQVTGQSGPGLDYFCNTRASYTLRGVHVRLDVLWRWEAAAGTGDTHVAINRGTKSRIEVRQGAAENFRPELYVVGDVKAALEARVADLARQFPGIAVKQRGQQVFLNYACVYCHQIRGTTAAGQNGPDLTHFGSRRGIAANTLRNNLGNLAGWIVDPQSSKPGNHMATIAVQPEDLQPLIEYLESLK
jgi:cytochrome c2